MANELYSTIGADPKSDAATLRKSYFRALREHTAENDPVGHQEVRAAWEVLSDEEKRRDYDRLQVGGGAVDAAMKAGLALMESEDYEEAARQFKRAAALSPDHLPARFATARALADADDFDGAIEVLRKAAEKFPGESGVWGMLGDVCLAHVREETDNESKRATSAHRVRLREASSAYDRCAILDPKGRRGYMGRAYVAYYLDDWNEVRRWARRAAGADGTVDFDDFEAYRLLLDSHLFQNDVAGVGVVIKEIEGFVPPDEDVREAAAEALGNIGLNVARAKAWDHAALILKVCVRLAPKHERIKELEGAVSKAKASLAALKLVMDDESINMAVRELAKWSYRSRFGDSTAEEDEQDLKEILEALASWDLSEVSRSVRIVKSRAGALWAARSDVWEHVERVSAQQGGQVQHSPSSSTVQTRHSTSSAVQTSNDGCGCLALVGFVGLATGATLLLWILV